MNASPPAVREASSEAVLPSRLLPRVSFRSLMILMTIAALVIAVVYAADQGGVYAGAAAAGMAFGLFLFSVSAIGFLLSWAVSFLPKTVGAALIVMGCLLLISKFVVPLFGVLGTLREPIWLICFQLLGWFLVLMPIGQQRDDESESPFAEGQLPPQILAPREPTN
jgi:hypothetical protein